MFIPDFRGVLENKNFLIFSLHFVSFILVILLDFSLIPFQYPCLTYDRYENYTECIISQY